MPATPVSSDPIPAPALLATRETEHAVWAIVFAGGIGSRFWPLSSPERPKPTLQLLGERSLVSDTIQRLAPIVPRERVLVLTSRDIAEAVKRAAPEIPAYNVLVEPRPLGTAAALAWGLEVIRSRGNGTAVVCALHADLASAFPDEFRAGLMRAVAVALRERTIVTIGVAPTRPEEDFGYVTPGNALDLAVPVSRGGACHVTRFEEKPPSDTIAALIQAGALWHAGIVVGQVNDLHEKLFARATEIGHGRDALVTGNLPAFAASVRPISIERGLLERSNDLIVLPVDCGWDDVGTWACLRRTRELDDDGNGAIGDVHFVDSASNVVHSEAGAVVMFGCERMLVVTLNGLTFVTPLDRAADLQSLLDRLPPSLKPDPRRAP
ncbi:MAG TPA: sugar phosphate nucleotidyltransferase [Gemmatimonadaceae bacterium]|nr:sugar phosphate nucleotidyltransferase [Gemmatimonadaceae bacterium]